MQGTSLQMERVCHARDGLLTGATEIALRPLQALMAAPLLLFLAALAAMLLRHPDVAFYGIDRVAFVLLVAGVAGRAVVGHHADRARGPLLCEQPESVMVRGPTVRPTLFCSH